MGFPSRFWKAFVERFRAPASSEPELIDESERLSRFIRQSGHFAASTGRVKPHAFMPPRNNPEVSVFRTEALSEDDVWLIASRHLDGNERRMKARGDFDSTGAIDLGLQVECDDVPPRHANLVGWPETKGERKLLAMKLADAATLVLRPEI